jgi:hypothetical protein
MMLPDMPSTLISGTVWPFAFGDWITPEKRVTNASPGWSPLGGASAGCCAMPDDAQSTRAALHAKMKKADRAPGDMRRTTLIVQNPGAGLHIERKRLVRP